jgi:ferredoxin-thioredoxin reductase catalytic subunit
MLIKTELRVLNYVLKLSEKNNWILNPNFEQLEKIIKGLAINFERYGYFNCPCRDSHDNKEKDRDIICPCEYSLSDIEEYGHCFCGLFLKSDYDIKNNRIQSIPERRPEAE